MANKKVTSMNKQYYRLNRKLSCALLLFKFEAEYLFHFINSPYLCFCHHKRMDSDCRRHQISQANRISYHPISDEAYSSERFSSTSAES